MPVNVINGPKRDSLSTEGGVMKGDIDMNGNKISNVGNPTSGGDVVTKEYLENNPPNINELPGILPISKGGTEASTKRAALNNLEGMPIISSIFEQSLDEIIESFALVDLRLTENEQLHSIIQGNYAYVITLFFAAQSTSSSRMQLAIGYNTRAMAMRTYYEYDGAWSDWNEVILASGGTMTGKLNVKDLVVCDGTLYPSVDYKADFDGPVKAQVLANMERNIVYFRNWCTDTNYYENYLTPDPDTGRTANGNYSILTTKETADYVVAQGISGGWVYRKWNSGRAECVRYLSTTPKTVPGTNSLTVTLPFTFTDTAYVVQITKAVTGFFVTDVIDANSAQNFSHKAGSFIVTYKYSSDTAYSVSFNISVAGSWK